jgi:Xaa-Pro aminopeptidase
MQKSHFQDFSEISKPELIAPRIKSLCDELKANKLDGFLIPRADMHRGESVQKRDERLAYISGFTGSAGLAIVGQKQAALFVDSRYVLQAPMQTDMKIFEIIQTPTSTITDWIKENFAKNSTIGFDAWLHSPSEITKLKIKLKGHAKLKATANPIDKIWDNRPPAPKSSIEFLGIDRSGKIASEKLADLQQKLATKNCDYIVLTLPQSICWLFNMRGSDVPNTPIILSFAIIPATGTPTLFFAKDKINHDSLAALDAIAILESKDNFASALKSLAKTSATIWIDSNSCPFAITKIFKKSNVKLYQKSDPILAMKAIKNSTELKGMKQAHLFDGKAIVEFLCWFDKNAEQGKLSEIDIVTQLENFRREEKTLMDISFDTISGAGANGAIVHYRVNEKSNRTLKTGELMLVDSGGQYLSGTTDITRTLFCSSASDEQKDSYTRVLKGMIAISMARFPKGTTGAQIDILARQYLWQKGKNYNHGTGHGVGAYLSVHEEGTGISPRVTAKLEEGHIISNEPGYYKEGEYGIRIENLIHVVKSKTTPGYLKFKTLTLAPIETRLIEQKLLTKDEVNWLNDYHKKVWKKISPFLKGVEKDWLKKATMVI